MARKGRHRREGNEQVVITLGAGKAFNSGSLAKTIQEELMQVGVQVDDDMQAIFDEVGKEGVKRLKETSPVNEKGKHSGRYAKGWIYDKKKTSNWKCAAVIRNKTDPQLTHLLEYGHPIVRKGKVVGEFQGKEHIGKVADWVAEEIEKQLTKTIGG